MYTKSGALFLVLLSVASAQYTRYTTFPPTIISSAWWNNIVPTFQQYNARLDNHPGCLCSDGVTPCTNWSYFYPFLQANTTADMTDYIIGVGSFGPKLINEEYDRVILGAAGTNCPGTTPFRLLSYDLGQVAWSYYIDPLDGHFCLTFASILNLTVDYRYLGGNLLEMDGLYDNQTACFDPLYQPAANISRQISVQDPTELKGLASVATSVNIPTLCGIIQSACTGSLQQYANQSDCEAYMATIPNEFGVCPESQAANTVNCRFLHALVAILPPVAPGEQSPAIVHCPHTGRASMPCVDHCLPSCANCASNQHCVSTATDPINPTYACICNDGYIKQADGSCQAASCTANYQCSSAVSGNVATCTNGLCGCAATFVWDVVQGKCTCPAGNFVSWAGSTAPQCVPVGRCLSHYECVDNVAGNTWNNVNCVQFGTNPFANYQTCVCAPGYQGGFSYPCTCPSPGRVEWSGSISMDVCLQPGQCANDYDCAHGQTCQGKANPPGTCA